MNPISKATSVVFHPVRTASSAAGRAYGVTAAGVRTTMRLIERVAGVAPEAPATTDPDPAVHRVAATRTTAKSTAKKAPSARAATAGPALARADAGVDAGADDELRTPAGIPAADEAHTIPTPPTPTSTSPAPSR